jgi:hypothetical protein
MTLEKLQEILKDRLAENTADSLALDAAHAKFSASFKAVLAANKAIRDYKATKEPSNDA